jgi:hypothetical protein
VEDYAIGCAITSPGCAKALPDLRVPVGGPFNFSAINIASGLELEAVGIAGAKLLYPSGAIQHAGVVVGMGDGAGHVNRYKYRGDYWRWADETRNVSAVTGACLGIRAELFRRPGGFDADFPNNYNDVDPCLLVREEGYRVACDEEFRARATVAGPEQARRFNWAAAASVNAAGAVRNQDYVNLGFVWQRTLCSLPSEKKENAIFSFQTARAAQHPRAFGGWTCLLPEANVAGWRTGLYGKC